jgi:hypothetical protein
MKFLALNLPASVSLYTNASIAAGTVIVARNILPIDVRVGGACSRGAYGKVKAALIIEPAQFHFPQTINGL